MKILFKKILYYLVKLKSRIFFAFFILYILSTAFIDPLDKGATLVSDHGDLHINQKLDDPVPDDTQLFVICNQKTISEIHANRLH